MSEFSVHRLSAEKGKGAQNSENNFWRSSPNQALSVKKCRKLSFHTEIEQMFEKKFQYQPHQEIEVWKLPPPGELFGEFYQLDSLQELKETLNNVKSKLNDYELEVWSLHTRGQDPASEIPWRLKKETKAEFVTIAWCKFYECLQSYSLVNTSEINSLHLCELPGAFIAALNHYLHSTYDSEKIHWNWLATTLNPYYEGNLTSGMISDDRLMFYTLDKWLMHDDFTGNIINCDNIVQIQQQCDTRLQGNVQLITADGSIDCVDAPDFQEAVVAPLHFAEITAALSILAEGGCFVLKMFTLFESTNVCKLFLLNCCFKEVHVFKPATSKRGNSEIYIICIGYKKDTKYLAETIEIMKQKVEANNVLPLFAKTHLPKNFLVQHEICARMFMNFQIKAIESNIYTFNFKVARREVTHRQMLRGEIAKEFYTRYKVQSIAKKETILGDKNTEGYCKSTPFCKGSYTAREMLKEISLEEKLFELQRKLNDLEKLLGNQYGTLFESNNLRNEVTASEMHIYRGKPFTVLNSSLFTNPQAIRLYHDFKDRIGCNPLCHEVQSVKVDNQTIIMDKALAFDFLSVQQHFFIELLKLLVEIQPREVTFTNVAFLSHFAVSLLCFLSTNVFDHIAITVEPAFQITLHSKCNEYDEDKLVTLKNLHELLENNSNVLCIMAIEQLHRNDFCDALVEYNNQLLLKNFKSILKN